MQQNQLEQSRLPVPELLPKLPSGSSSRTRYEFSATSAKAVELVKKQLDILPCSWKIYVGALQLVEHFILTIPRRINNQAYKWQAKTNINKKL